MEEGSDRRGGSLVEATGRFQVIVDDSPLFFPIHRSPQPYRPFLVTQ